MEGNARRLRALEHQHQRARLAEIRGVDFCSNDYLGLAEHPLLRECAASRGKLHESGRNRVAIAVRPNGKIGGNWKTNLRNLLELRQRYFSAVAMPQIWDRCRRW